MSSIRHDQGHRFAPGSALTSTRAWMSRGTLSIVIPARDEAANLPELLDEIAVAFRPLVGRTGGPHPLRRFEVVVVDDGSIDSTGALLGELAWSYPELRVVTLARNSGQSAATIAGFRASWGDWVGMLDADLQNPPASLARMWDVLPGYDAALGWRRVRRDSRAKRVVSRLANAIRNAVLGQAIRDTGCSVRILRRELALRLPMFRGGHRFLGPLLIREGCRIVQIPVEHRPRVRGRSHYRFGNRSLRVVVDLIGVLWLLRRPVRYQVVEGARPAPIRAGRAAERVRS